MNRCISTFLSMLQNIELVNVLALGIKQLCCYQEPGEAARRSDTGKRQNHLDSTNSDTGLILACLKDFFFVKTQVESFCRLSLTLLLTAPAQITLFTFRHHPLNLIETLADPKILILLWSFVLFLVFPIAFLNITHSYFVCFMRGIWARSDFQSFGPWSAKNPFF